jgi:hypothetical protein
MDIDLNLWHNQDTYANAKSYTCGYCARVVAARTGFGGKQPAKPVPGMPQYSFGHEQNFDFTQYIALCPNCAKPTFWDGDKQIPGAAFGEDVKHLPLNVEILYRESRNCMAVNCFTAGAMACRKILMNVAVDRGAPEGLKFIQYVNYLADNGYVPPNGKDWVNHIRDKGNEAVHEIPSLSKDDLSDLLVFTEMLLKFIFEFPNRVPKKP